jgi:hypothetical protein
LVDVRRTTPVARFCILTAIGSHSSATALPGDQEELHDRQPDWIGAQLRDILKL